LCVSSTVMIRLVFHFTTMREHLNNKFSLYKVILPTLLAVLLFILALFFVFIPSYEQGVMAGKQEMLKELTNTAWSLLDNYEKLSRAGKLTRAEAQKKAIDEIDHLRYGSENKDYYWITDTIPVMIMHPYRGDLNGKNIMDFEDARGKKLFSEFVKIARRDGQGYSDYMWQWKDDPKTIVLKRSFVKEFKPWGWIIGTGIYIEDVKNDVDNLTRHIIYVSGGIISIVILLLSFVIWQSINADKQRQRAVDELLVSENQLKELSATKDKLFSIIAHDLRSPFNVILGFSGLVNDQRQTFSMEEVEGFMKLIHTQASETLNLLDNLLSWSKNQTGQISFNPGELQLSPLVNGVLEDTRLAAAKKEISLNNCIDEGVVVHADQNMLMTILRNLVSNAIKYTNPGGSVNIYASTTPLKAEITVSDNGVGIDQETRENLFLLNDRSSRAGTANEKGTGLGLLICKEFVERHGGEIRVESGTGEGSDFKFTLPRQPS